MRALVVAPQPFFTPRGTPLSVYYRTLVSAELGVEVDLLTYGEGQDVEIPGVRIIRIPRFGFLGPVPVGPSLLKAFLDVFLILWLVSLLLRNRYDFVHAHEEAVFPCLALKPVFRFKLVYDMHSCLPQQLSNFHFTASRLLRWIFERLERAALATSDAVITICPALADYALGELRDPAKHLLIENSIFEPLKLRSRNIAGGGPSSPPSAEVAPIPIPSAESLFVYAGTLEPYQGIDLLLEAFQRASARMPDAQLLIVGGRPDQVESYSGRARELGIDASTLFTGRVPPDVARAYSARADVLVSPRTEGTNTPLKIYEQLASGIPLVATKIYSHTQIIDEHVAFLADPDPSSFADALVAAIGDPGARADRVAAAQSLYQASYSRAAYVEKMGQLLEKLR